MPPNAEEGYVDVSRVPPTPTDSMHALPISATDMHAHCAQTWCMDLHDLIKRNV